jgi:predicted kinase
MRKWMRERLQRRKKTSTEAKEQPAPPPLQPAYFDAEQSAEPARSTAEPEQAAPSSTAYEGPSEAARDVAPGEEPSASAAESTGEPPAQAQGSSRQAGRGRRRRGGRGRGGAGREGGGREKAVAQAFAPKGTVAGAPAPVEEVQPAEYPDAEAPVPLAAPQAPPIPAAAQRPPKGIVVLAIGLPGSGKSTWFKRHNVTPLSSDIMRSLLFDDIREQRYQDLVFSNLRSLLKARLIAKRPMNYVDATNLTPQERQHWIKLARDYQYEVHAVFFDVPLQVCIERHQRRDRVVPEDVMRRMAAKLKPPTFEEGFAKITVVRVKKKEQEAG